VRTASEVDAERAKLPLTAIDEAIATLQEKREAVEAAQAALRPAEMAGEAGGPDGKRGRK
jgi:hypothetical protein